MSRLAYLESLSRKDDEHKHKNYSDANITKLVKLVESKTLPGSPTKRYAIEAEPVEIDWVSIAFNTAIAVNPFAPPLARLRSGLKVAEQLAFIDDAPLSAVDALEKLDII